ncbi:SbcC/MukB-like Walker B domain-containing protein [Ruminococcus sp.]|uniref:ATP-binding protein n=1 Tax=Ruminococcus sp. TaxID=41978 RepID=UPI0025E34DBE|nr:SbcC/MukB-like Walker B domain-containing protein [Ruminococcus sp.]
MKRLNRLLLINWHYFDKQIVDFGDINFLTGKNTAGKSTVIDALQVVLMGETRSSAFNRAANKKSERTLKSYLIGSLGEDVESGNKSKRGGQNFTTYIVVEIYDDIRDEYFCLGAAFDSYADGSEIRKRFFYMKDRIPENHFIENKTAINTIKLAEYLKANHSQNRYTITGTVETYREDVRTRLNVHESKMFSMLKKAISFEPINDIERFITENVCDIEDDIDTASMQENIAYYMRQEQIANAFEEKLAALETIRTAYGEVERYKAQQKRQKFLIDYASFETLKVQLCNAEKQIEQYGKDIEDHTREYNDLQKLIAKLEEEKEKLTKEKDEYWRDKDGDRIKEDIARYEKLIQKADNEISQFVLNIRRNCEKWIAIISAAKAKENSEQFVELADKLCEMLERLGNIREDGLDEYSVAFLENINEQFNLLKEYLMPIISDLISRHSSLNDRKKQLEETIAKLKKGVMQYPERAQRFKDVISTELYKLHGHSVQVDFFADLIDITDEEWHNAVEGYLNTQRMNLIIAPEYFEDAYHIYKGVRHDIKAYEYRIVDCEKVLNAHRNLAECNLAEVVSSENKYAKAYAEFLMGGVTRCYDDKRIRDHKKSVTRECMTYSGFSVGSLNKQAYQNPYIGRGSIEKQIELKERELEEVKSDILLISGAVNALAPINGEWFLTSDYISSAAKSAFQTSADLVEYKNALKEWVYTFNKIDFNWLGDMESSIKQKGEEIDSARENKEDIYSEIKGCEGKKAQLINETIPKIKSEITDAQNLLSDIYDEEYISTTKANSYDIELKNRKTPEAIKEAFVSPLKQTETILQDKIKKLIDLRVDFNRAQNLSFDYQNTDSNEIYEKEYVKIKDTELPKYREQIEKAKIDAMEQFKSDFLYKLKRNIEETYKRIDDLNRALREAKFGNDTYRFKVEPNPAYREYYDMIMSDLLMSGDATLFSYDFTSKYQSTLDSLFSQIISLSDNDGEKANNNIEIFSKYKTYLSFDLFSTDSNGRTDRLSKSIFTKSGGETQTPFYIAVLASFAQLYKVNDTKEKGNTFRLVIFDEAFNKMDPERIEESVKLLKHFKLQAILCSSEKIDYIAPLADKTLFVVKGQSRNGYTSKITEWTKEMSDSIDELSE